MTSENQVDKNDPAFLGWKRVFKLVKNIAKVRSPKGDVHLASGSVIELLSMTSGQNIVAIDADVDISVLKDGLIQFTLSFANTPEYFEVWVREKYAKAIHTNTKSKIALRFVVEPVYTNRYSKFLKDQKKHIKKIQKAA